MRYPLLPAIICWLLSGQQLVADEPVVAKVIARWDAPEATQAVAVDEQHFYAIASSVIGKYDKATGKQVARWAASEDYPLQHLNAGIIFDGRLYCSHSNFPTVPESSSVEIFDTKTLQHVGNHSFGYYEGSLTWVDQHDGSWWAVFAHYSHNAGNNPLAKPHQYTSLVRFDKQWRRTGGWVFPTEVLDRFAPHSSSGGTWGSDGCLYCTGHDLGELYQLQIPKAGSTLKLVRTISLEITGQGIAWDRSSPGILYGISRPKRQVIVSRIPALAD
jgi:hypothetical protein